jgi:RND superfamily putative drug exporter
MRHPARYLALGLLGVLLLAAPTVRINLAATSAYDLPASESTAGLLALRSAIGIGTSDPIVVLVDTGRPGGVAAQGPAIARLLQVMRGVPGIGAVQWLSPSAAQALAAGNPLPAVLQGGIDLSARYTLVNLKSPIDPGSAQARALIARLRATLATASRGMALRPAAGGIAAFNADFHTQVYDHFPLVILVVLLVTYLVLLWAFRSVLLPLKAVALNLLSVMAAFGTLVAVFQWGWGARPLAFHAEGLVADWIPAFLFAFLFGLSMDYEVFMVTRIREGWERGMSNTRAVAYGLSRTGRLITCAAAIMVLTFSGFVVGRDLDLKMFGFGLAAAIFVDATLIRIVLVPALMKLFGAANWWLPRPLARLLRAEGRRSSLDSDLGDEEGAA